MFPRQGAWYASLDVAGDEAQNVKLSALTTLKIDGLSYSCTPVVNAASGFGRRRINVVGGGGTMSNPSTARNVANGPSSTSVIGTILKDAPRDSVGTNSVSAFVKTFQTVKGLSVGKQLSRFLLQFGAVWRVQSDGKLLIKSDTYPAASLPKDSQLSGVDEARTRTYSVQEFDTVPSPGTTLDGERIEEVEIEFDGTSSTLHMRPVGLDSALSEALTGTRRSLAFSQSWPGTVTSQSGQTLDINPDDPDFKGSGLGKVQMTFGLPGINVQVSPGTRVRFCYDGSDPGRPRVCAFEEGSGGAALLVTVGDTASAQFMLLYDSFKTFFDAHTHPTGTGPSGPPVVPMDPSLATTKLKSE